MGRRGTDRLFCFSHLTPPPTHPQIEGRGNGIKTNVVNNVDIAKALERPPDCACCVCVAVGGETETRAPASHSPTIPFPSPDIVKYYGCELGAQTKFDKKV